VFIAGIIFATIFCASANAQQWIKNSFSEMRWRCIGPFRGAHLPFPACRTSPAFSTWRRQRRRLEDTDFGNTWNPIFDDAA